MWGDGINMNEFESENECPRVYYVGRVLFRSDGGRPLLEIYG